MKVKNWFIDFAKGLGVGLACIIPGVSGGTIALSLKIYKKLVNAIGNLFTKRFVKNFLILLPIALGVVVAIIAMWVPLKLAFEHVMFAIVCLFAGFIAGGVPGVVDNVKGEKVKKSYVIVFVVCLVIAVLCGVLSVVFKLDMSQLFVTPYKWYLYLIMIPVGFVAACALVVPGISGSMILLVLGFYTQILNLVDVIKTGQNIGTTLGVLGCLALGVIIGAIVISKIMSVLLNKFKIATFYGIIGLIIGSLFSLFYNFEIVNYYTSHGVAWWEFVIGFIALAGGVVGGYFLVRYQRKLTAKELEEVPNEN